MILTALANNDLLTRLSKNLDLRNIAQGNLVVSLHRGFPGFVGENEIANNAYYFRQGVNFNPAAGGEITNATLLQWFKKTGDTVITENLFYSDTFNRANIPYCSSTTMGDPNWRVYTGCAAISSNQLKLGHNTSFNVKMQYDNAGALPSLAGQYTRARLRSWRLNPATGLFVMATTPVALTAPSFGLVGYMALVIPDKVSTTGGSINNAYVKLFRRGQVIASIYAYRNPMAEWTITAIPFVDHTFIQIKQEQQTWIEYADYTPGRASAGYQGLAVFYAGADTFFRSGYDSTWEDWEAGGASLSVDGGGGSPNVLITHLGFWTANEGLFLGSAKLNSPVHLLLNQILTIDIGDLKLQVNSGTDEFRDINLDRFGRGVNFTTAPLQFSLHTADPGNTGADEISGSRIVVPVETWDIASEAITTNGTKIDFPGIATTAAITHLGCWSIEGAFLFGVELATPINATLPLQTIRFLQGRLKFLVPSSAIGFLTAPGVATVAFSGVGIAVGAVSMAGIGAAAFDSSAIKVSAMTAAGLSSAAFTGVGIFPGWNTWNDSGDVGTGLNSYPIIGDGTTRIYYGVNTGSAGTNRFRSLLKSNLTTFTTHTTPFSALGIISLCPMDDGDTVFMGSSNGGGAVAYKFTHSGGFTNLTWPGASSDGILMARHPTDIDLLFIGNQATNAAGSVRLYTYKISTTTWTQIGGDALNGSWNVSSTDKSVSGFTFDGTYIYVLVGGGTANLCDIYRATLGVYNDWTKIGGGTTNGSWATGTKRNGRLAYSTFTGKLYACIGGSSNGDAEVWECASPGTAPAWTQIGGDSINSSWATGTNLNCARVTLKLNKLITGIAGSTAADCDLWQWDLLTSTWTQIGGDSIDSGWSGAGQSQLNSCHIDREDRLWASPSNAATSTPALWWKSVV